MKNIADEEIKSDECSKLVLQAYSMKPMDEITALLNDNKPEAELDESDQNLLYFYKLINDFFNVHKQHQNCTKL